MMTPSIPRALGAAFLVLAAGPALAHAHLLTSEPGAAASGPAPRQLRLTFSEGVEKGLTKVSVSGPDGTAVAAGPEALSSGDTVLALPLPDSLKPGTYTVDWRALAKDGHTTTGQYRFTVMP